MKHSLLAVILVSCVFNLSQQCYHTFKVIDEDTGRGIPMANLTTVDLVPHYSDSNGVVAYFEPDMLLNLSVATYFTPLADGYIYTKKDWLGLAGFAVECVCGGRTVVPMKRTIIAQRLYRVTGRGIYRDSYLTGEPVNGLSRDFIEKKMLLKHQVLGQDSVMTIKYRNKMYWFYGDTNKLSYALGSFYVAGATTPVSGWDVETGIDLNYITNGPDDSFIKGLAPDDPPVGGPSWIHAPWSNDNQNDLYVTYLRPMGGDIRGFLKWNDTAQKFDHVLQFNSSVNVWPTDGGHQVLAGDRLLFGNPYPHVRTLPDSYVDIDKYEAWTCLKEGTGIPKDITKVKLDRAPNGHLLYGWKKNTSPLTPNNMNDLVNKKILSIEEAAWLQMRSSDSTAELVIFNAGTVYFNKYRNRWVLIGEQVWGKDSFIGEIWYSESCTPLGPWTHAIKVLSHKSRDFYNPVHHSFLDNGPNLYFEGTYVNTFDKGAAPTPYYDYNQQLYKLELNDTRLFEIPSLVWWNNKTNQYELVQPANDIQHLHFKFFAYDRPCNACIPIYQDGSGDLFAKAGPGRDQVFYAKKDFECVTDACTTRRKELVTADNVTVIVQRLPPIVTGKDLPVQAPHVSLTIIIVSVVGGVIGLLIIAGVLAAIILHVTANKRKRRNSNSHLLLNNEVHE